MLKDNAVYVNGVRLVFILSYINNLFYTGPLRVIIKNARNALGKVIELEQRDTETYLGIKILRYKKGITIDQNTYINYMLGTEPLRTYGMPATTATLTNAVPFKGTALIENRLMYQRLIGQIIYPII